MSKTRRSNGYSNLNTWKRGAPSSLKDEELVAKLASAGPAFEILEGVLKNMEQGKRPSLSDYDNPNWACRQAHRNGFNEALRLISELIS